MKLKKNGSIYVISLEIDEDLFETLLKVALQERIEAAEIAAIGAIKNFELGYYFLDRKEYGRQGFQEIVEVLSCSGNLALKNGEPFLHLHAALGRSDFSVIGGHLFSAHTAVTLEVVLNPFQEGVHRAYDAKTGLFLLDLPFCKAR